MYASSKLLTYLGEKLSRPIEGMRSYAEALTWIGSVGAILWACSLPLLVWTSWSWCHTMLLCMMLGSWGVSGFLTVAVRLATCARGLLGGTLIGAICSGILWLCHIVAVHLISEMIGDDPGFLQHSVTAITCILAVLAFSALGVTGAAIILFYDCMASMICDDIHARARRATSAIGIIALSSFTVYATFLLFMREPSSVERMVVALDYHAGSMVGGDNEDRVAYMGNRVSIAHLQQNGSISFSTEPIRVKAVK